MSDVNWLRMSSEIDKLFKLGMDHNLDEIIRFQNYIRGHLQSTHADISEHKFAANTLINYEQRLRELTFLSIYAYLKEYLYLLWRHRANGQGRARGYSIKRYCSVIKKLCRGVVPDSWQYLLDMTEIRHCLIHANGRISFMNNVNDFNTLLDKYPGKTSVIHGDRLQLEIELLSDFVEQIRAFRNDIDIAT